jgi:hypothetical protein
LALSPELRRELDLAQQEAQRVGDSPIKADRLADTLQRILGRIDGEEMSDELRSRLRAALADAERVLRRDDDGKEAARHLQSALRLAQDRPRRPSPFD